jgi:hypothetical protein
MECAKLLKTRLNKDVVYYDGFLYNIHSSKNDITRRRCKKRTCTGFIHTDQNLVVLNQKSHNHDASVNEV